VGPRPRLRLPCADAPRRRRCQAHDRRYSLTLCLYVCLSFFFLMFFLFFFHSFIHTFFHPYFLSCFLLSILTFFISFIHSFFHSFFLAHTDTHMYAHTLIYTTQNIGYIIRMHSLAINQFLIFTPRTACILERGYPIYGQNSHWHGVKELYYCHTNAV